MSSTSVYTKNDLYKAFGDSMAANQSNQKVYADVEQLKQVVNVLLHFKYMLVYVRKNLPDEFDFKLKSIAPEFEADFDFCLEQYGQLSDNCIFVDLIRKREQFYEVNDGAYCSFKQQYLFDESPADVMCNQHEHHQHSANDHDSAALGLDNLRPESMVDTIIGEQSSDLNLEQSQHIKDGFSSTETSQGSSSFNNNNNNNSQMISESQPMFNLSQLQMDGTGAIDSSMNLVDESNKLYVNLLDLLPKTNATVAGASSAKELLDGGQQVAASGHKRVRQSSPQEGPTSKYSKASDTAAVAVSAEPKKTMPVESNHGLSTDDSESMHVENDLPLQVEYWCSFEGCRFKSKSLTQVKAHEERRHVKQIVKCAQDGCGSFFDTKDDLNSHMSDIHSGPLFKCALDVCLKEFQSDYRLKQHIREEHRDAYLTCKVCTKKFKTRKYLTRHFRNVHPKEKITDEIVTTLNNLDSKNTPMKCTIDNCDSSFVKRSKLKQHIKTEHNEEYLTCKFCDKVCKTRNNLTNHIWIMHEEGDFRCTVDDCDFSSKFRKNLLNHKKLRHQRVRQCPMNDCGEMIPITRYQRHMSSLHKIKNYACSWPDCGKSFADHNALKNHVRIHLNFKRYKCKWEGCGYASEQRFTVITHIRVCHFKLPRTKKKQLEMNISQDSLQNPYEYLEVCRQDICI